MKTRKEERQDEVIFWLMILGILFVAGLAIWAVVTP